MRMQMGGRGGGISFTDEYKRVLQEAIDKFLQSEEGQQALKGQTASFEINVRGARSKCCD